MENLKLYFNNISPLTDQTWDRMIPMLNKETLPKNQFFAKENQIAQKIAFLETGVVRAYFINNEGKDAPHFDYQLVPMKGFLLFVWIA